MQTKSLTNRTNDLSNASPKICQLSYVVRSDGVQIELSSFNINAILNVPWFSCWIAMKITYFLSDQAHDTNPVQNNMALHSFFGNTISICWDSVRSWLTKMTHEHRYVGPTSRNTQLIMPQVIPCFSLVWIELYHISQQITVNKIIHKLIWAWCCWPQYIMWFYRWYNTPNYYSRW